MTMNKFEDLKGKIITSINQIGISEIIFTLDNKEKYKMFHRQSCCENVTIEDVCGDYNDLLNSPILLAEEIKNNKHPNGFKPEFEPSSFTWTFYKLSTIKGSVTIRWYGESNGYYSESVDFESLLEEDNG